MSILTDIASVDLLVDFNLNSAKLGERPMVRRQLSDLRNCFMDTVEFEAALEQEDSLLYEVSAVEAADGPGQLHYGLGILYSGKIGDEYYMTKGHYHSTREAAEIYIGLKGEGVMLLEDEATGVSKMVPLRANSVVYVPGFTAHRTMNTGDEPLVYIGVYPSNAGHDYGSIADQNFSHVVVERDGQPMMKKRV
jgi:glucose-6-phosphate isomerase